MKTPISSQRPAPSQPSQAGPSSKQATRLPAEARAKKSEKAQQAGSIRSAKPVDRLEGEDEVSQVSSRRSPLAEAVFAGLEELANKYYGNQGHNALTGIEVLARTAGQQPDSSVSKEFIDLRARSLSKEIPELGQDKARELLTNIAQLLAPT
ncbi:MAG: hypothetical protein HYV07_01465 [Deltaproteobacteria bacterium]|nr:hypothetical protein [Deltaproteobacteria bacterium]